MNNVASRLYPYTAEILGSEDAPRGEHSYLRYCMLHGQWGDWLEEAIKSHVPHIRRVAWGVQDQSSNVFRGIASEVGGVPYLSEPSVEYPPGGEALVGRNGIMERAGYWPLMQGACEDLVGLREMGMRLAYTSEGGLVAEPISPHLMTAWCPPWAPQTPHALSVYDLRQAPGGGYLWTRETWDISDSTPSYRIESVAKGEDMTAAYAVRQGDDGQVVPATSGDLSGESYPWRWTQAPRKGKPYIPVPIYHAMRRASVWDPWYGVEAVAGSLTLAVLHTFWVHCVRDGSIATVALINGVPVGVTVEAPDGDGPPVAWVAIEAGAFNLFSAIGDQQPQLVQLRPQAEPLQLIQAIQSFEQRVALYAGVSASDLSRESGDPRSGYALAVSNDGKRRASRRLEPQLRVGDTQVMEIAAALANAANGTSIPETGYRPSYGVLPVSIDEQEAALRYVTGAMSAGLMTRRDALRRLRPEMTEQDITLYLTQAASERAAISLPPAL